MKQLTDADIASILRGAKNIAVVGASDNPYRDSYIIMNFLVERGYKIFPVNPKYKSILNITCHPTLLDVTEKIDIVDIFRRPEDVHLVVEEAVRIHSKTIWMQLGAFSEDASRRAAEAGLNVISHRCIKVDYLSLIGN